GARHPPCALADPPAATVVQCAPSADAGRAQPDQRRESTGSRPRHGADSVRKPAMALRRIHDTWGQLKPACGTPRSRGRRGWRAGLERRPWIAYWGGSWFTTRLSRNLAWHSFSRMAGMSIRLGGPGQTAARMFTPAACRDNA